MLAMTMMFGSLLAYASTVPQIFAGACYVPKLMAGTFAFCASAIGVASYFNSRIVERVGMPRISHIALVSFVGISACHTFVAYQGWKTLVVFTLFQAATMATFGLAASNFGAIAMQPLVRSAAERHRSRA